MGTERGTQEAKKEEQDPMVDGKGVKYLTDGGENHGEM